MPERLTTIFSFMIITKNIKNKRAGKFQSRHVLIGVFNHLSAIIIVWAASTSLFSFFWGKTILVIVSNGQGSPPGIP